MASLRSIGGSRLRRITVLVTLLAAAVIVWLAVGAAGPASARSLSKLRADVEEGAGSCGNPTGGDVIGKATFARKGKLDMLVVTYSLTDGKPNTKYLVELWEQFGSDCKLLGDFGILTTDAHGTGSRQFKWGPIGSVTDVFADGYDLKAGEDNDSVAVSL